jgi:DNA helicase-2/ATP-dependent DNA helicase PcrA
LSDEQIAVRDHDITTHGRVIAGPGTGKSTAAVGLAKRLIDAEGQPTFRFLTFTRAATGELARKLEETLGGAVVRPSTIHSFALSAILRNPGCSDYPRPLRLPDDYEAELIWGHLSQRSNVRKDRIKKKLVPEMAAKWESLDETAQRSDVDPRERARFLGVWGEHRRIFGYTLLQEIPDLFRKALRDHPMLQGVDHRVLIVDEYQDLNACDLEVILRLAGRGAAVLAVGDDDQSIYSFRKAHPAGIRNFPRAYGARHDYPLTECWRLPQRIIEWAQHVIDGAPDRDPAKPPLVPADPGREGTVALLRFGSEGTEARGVAQLAQWLIETGQVERPSDVLIVTRTDYLGLFTKPIKDRLARLNVPVADVGSVEVLLAEPTSRYLLALLRLLVDREDSLAWLTLIHLAQGLGPSLVDHLHDQAKANNMTFGTQLVAAAGTDFTGTSRPGVAKGLWQSVSNTLAGVQLPLGARAVPWGQLIVDEVEGGRLPPCPDELKELLVAIDPLADPDADLQRFLSQIQPLGEDRAREHSDGVRIMTMTGCKGLTVQATIIAGVDNHLVPRPDGDPDEERRLLYVAMTRAKEFLFITWAAYREGPTARVAQSGRGMRPLSQFLDGGPVEPVDGTTFVRGLGQPEPL